MSVYEILSSVLGSSCAICNSVVIGLLAVLILSYQRRLCIIIRTLPRDLRIFYRCFKTAVYLVKYAVFKETLISLFQQQVKKNPDKPVFYFQDKTWTFSELDKFSNKIAKVFKNQGYQRGDVVALLCNNCPEYVSIWLGLGKIGVITALINTNLKFQSLAHCVNVAKCKGFIYTLDFSKDVNEIRDQLPENLEYITYGDSQSLENECFNIKKKLDLVDDEPIIQEMTVKPQNKFLYIYTSGTTGLPKAAIITHFKLVFLATGLKCMLNLRSDDVIYDPLPLYHTAGGVLGIIGSLAYGMTTVIRIKFSASNYFSDCIKYNCTVAQYIGEICRYLLVVPPSEYDKKHSLRMVVGNGLRPDVWKEFVNRFKIPNVLELYGSTEGNTNIINIDGTVGAVGILPRLLPSKILPIQLIKYNEDIGEPVRDSKGLCIRCEPGEVGMCVGTIRKGDLVRDFQGYVDETETSKKIIKNVFKRGDRAFLSGDLLIMDEYGYLYFKDRTGDTFRWKGENVSTIEIEIAISKIIGFKDCTVYGVHVGNLEGQAGMLAIVDPKKEVNLDSLFDGIDKNLPPYARPLFLRIIDKLKCTGTYKVVKTELKNEGFDVHKIKDRLYFKHQKQGFVPLTESLYNDILSGVVKV